MIKYTDEELLEKIRKKAKELGRTPKKREMKGCSTYLIRFKTWNNAVELAGLQVLKETDLSKEDIKRIILEEAKKLGRTPFESDFENNIYLPSSRKIRKEFGKCWTDVIVEVGLEPIINYIDESLTNEEVLELFKEELKKLGDSPKAKDFNKSSRYCYEQFASRLDKKTWNDLLIHCGYDINKEVELNENELLDKLKKLIEKLGYIPSQPMLLELSFPWHGLKARGYNYKEVLEKIGYTNPRKTPKIVKESDEELLEMYIDFSRKIGKDVVGATVKDLNTSEEVYNADVFAVRFGGMAGLKKLAGFEAARSYKLYSKKQIKNMLLKEYRMNKRKLSNAEIENNKNLPSVGTFLRYFKTTKMSKVWKEILNDD